MPPDENNPFTPDQVEARIREAIYKKYDISLGYRLKFIVIPDIESVNYGRGVGYDIIEHVPPPEIHDISATKIREEMGAAKEEAEWYDELNRGYDKDRR